MDIFTSSASTAQVTVYKVRVDSSNASDNFAQAIAPKILGSHRVAGIQSICPELGEQQLKYYIIKYPLIVCPFFQCFQFIQHAKRSYLCQLLIVVNAFLAVNYTQKWMLSII